ncbi:SusC/RagA family TonB-linked outer membrane protein [Roseivirga sp. BDSF3-8]|uniref:SusC/RagA family TonB-linked outer membrane protein n=1 Tax=Roseivirga sp. BDSF3-8 TaxID=3241598 RepID=UPI003531D032
MRKHYLLALLCLFMSGTAWAQFVVTGQVISDLEGDPIPGVSVLVNNGTTGTVTDINGNYRVNVPGSSGTLSFSFVGFITEQREVSSSQTTLDVVMTEDITQLEEIVVTGLASSIKRSNLANSVETVNAEELTGTTTQQTLDNALYGKVAGVNMNSNSGAPGGGVSLQFRGISTLGAGSSQPLYIIDGVYVNNSTVRTGRSQLSGASDGASASNQDGGANRIADINPEDIENIEILKGPSAAAIYGTRANAGVIIITTKKGKAGKPQVRLSQDIGIAEAQNLQGLEGWNEDKIETYFGTDERGQLELQRYRDAVNEGRVMDLEEEIYGETALLSKTQLSVSGGGDKMQYFVSGSVQDEEGIVKNTGFERYSGRVNLTFTPTDRISVKANTGYSRSDSDRGFTGNQNNTGGSLGYTIAYTPSYADLKPNDLGVYPNNPYFNDNPFAIRDLAENNQTVDRFVGAVGADFDLISKDNSFLQLKINGGVDMLSSNSLVYFPEFLQSQQATANPGDVMHGRQEDLNLNFQAFLVYNWNLNTVNMSTQGGFVRLDQQSDFLLMRGQGLVGGQKNLAWAQVVNTQEQSTTRITDFGYVVQQDANWEDRIIGTVGVRFDKSTLNLQQDEFYVFPRASVAVNLNNFDFYESTVMNRLKIRAAYGQTGGLPSYRQTFVSLVPQVIGDDLGGKVPNGGVSPDLVPETAAELELGVDAAFFGDRITLEATYYEKNVYDLILDLPTSEATGTVGIATNAAELQNKGWEVTLGLTPVRQENFIWSSQVLFWRNRSEITELNIPTFTTGGFGPSLGSYLIAEGFSPTTIVGTPATTDVEGGYTVYGDRQADFNLSFRNDITIAKNLDLGILVHWKKGGQNINLSGLLWDDGGTTPYWSDDDNDNGVPDGTDRLLAWAADGNTGVYIQDADYVKLRELGLYYRIPESIVESISGGAIERIKIGASANNILLWTPYESYDPEVSNFGSQPISSNIEVAPYPSSRRFFFHLNVDF